MSAGLAIDDLLDYTDWERHKWLEWLLFSPLMGGEFRRES